jgi:hypothetical protein
MKKIILLTVFALSMIKIAPVVYAETRTIMTDAKASIGSILELSISQEGQSELRFGNIRPSAIDSITVGPVRILVEVNSNSGERYQVTQSIGGPLENVEGNQIGLDHLKFQTSASNSNGYVVSSPTAVSASPQIIFTSDTQGRSDTIAAEYTLTVPPSQEPGDYFALLTYTVSSL